MVAYLVPLEGSTDVASGCPLLRRESQASFVPADRFHNHAPVVHACNFGDELSGVVDGVGFCEVDEAHELNTARYLYTVHNDDNLLYLENI